MSEERPALSDSHDTGGEAAGSRPHSDGTSEGVPYRGVLESVSPVTLSALTLSGIFLVYQLAGGALSLLLAGDLSAETVQLHRLLQIAAQALFIALPVLLLVPLHTGVQTLFTSPTTDFLALSRLPSWKATGLAALGVIVLNPLLSYLGSLQSLALSAIGFDAPLAEFKALYDSLIRTLTRIDTPVDFLLVVLAVAVTPAVCEELLFRGYTQRNLARALSPLTAAVVTGVIFGLYHLNPFDTLPLIALGVYLSVLRYLSGSLWTAAAAHFANNFFSIVGLYIVQHGAAFGLSESMLAGLESAAPDISSLFAISSAAISAVVFAVLLWLFRAETAAHPADEPTGRTGTGENSSVTGNPS